MVRIIIKLSETSVPSSSSPPSADGENGEFSPLRILKCGQVTPLPAFTKEAKIGS